jgi:hypothetical protein
LRRSFESKLSLSGAKFGQSFPMPKHGREQSDERQKGYFARLLDVPYNRLKKLPHLDPELPSPLESFFSEGRFCCELLPGRWALNPYPLVFLPLVMAGRATVRRRCLCSMASTACSSDAVVSAATDPSGSRRCSAAYLQCIVKTNPFKTQGVLHSLLNCHGGGAKGQ